MLKHQQKKNNKKKKLTWKKVESSILTPKN